MSGLLTILAALMLQTTAPADPPGFEDRVGDVYETSIRSVSQSSSDYGSSGSSTSGGMLTERIIAIRDGDIELEFDLPPETSQADRAREWQFPARVLKPAEGKLQLLNAPQLEDRLQTWLQAAGLTPEKCGLWFFTWTAFKVECDPQAVLTTLTDYDLRPGSLIDGAPYRIDGAIDPMRLREETKGPTGSVYVGEVGLDPEAVRRQRAEADVIVAQVSGQPMLTLDSALRARAAERIAGTVAIRLETDASGRLTRRIRITSMQIASQDGIDKSTTTETTVRRLVSRSQ